MRIGRALVASLLAAAVVAVTLAGCSHTAERTLLTQFFAASRLRDNTALRDLATVSFEPTVQGIVTRYDITRVTPAADAGGRVVSKEVMISAPVRLPGGRIVEKRFVVTMHPAPREEPAGRWIITAIRDVPADPSIPPL